MKLSIVAHLMSPIHVISALSAIKTCNKGKKYNITFIVYWPGSTPELARQIGKVIRSMTKSLPNILKIEILSESDFQKILSKPNLFTIKVCDQIYYPHDVVGNMFQFFCEKFPEAVRVCYGDGMGLIFEKKVHIGLISKKLGRSITSSKYDPDKMVLILPIYQSKGYLSRTPLKICPKTLVVNTLNKIIYNSLELQSYLSSLLIKYKSYNKFLLLTENFSEGGFLSQSTEIDMWESIIRKNVPSGSLIFVKAHPGETWNRSQVLKKKLNKEYQIVSIEKAFIKYPVELWVNLIKRTEILTLSYPALSLKYLYNKDTIFCLTDTLITKWFPKNLWRSYRNSQSLYEKPLQRLGIWDGTSVLWQGSV